MSELTRIVFLPRGTDLPWVETQVIPTPEVTELFGDAAWRAWNAAVSEMDNDFNPEAARA